MSRQIICVTQNIALDALSNTFKKVSGVCVVDDEKRLIGVVSRKDLRERQGVSHS
jgi:CBS domain-containing protein